MRGEADRLASENRPKAIKRRRMPVQQRARHTVDAIIQATEELVSQRRFDEVNTRIIAERAGVSIGSLYQYFPTYESILLAWYERVASEAAHQIRIATLDMMDRPLDEAVPHSCAALLRLYEQHWIPLIEMPRQVPQIAQAIRHTSLERLNRGNIRLYFSQHPEFDSALAERHVFFIETFVNAIMERYVIDRPPSIDFDDVINEVTFFISSYLERSRKPAMQAA